MKPGVARCSILLLSEDSARDAHAVLAVLARHMLRLIDPAVATHHIRFEPPESDAVRRAIRGNLWKSNAPQHQNDRRALIGYIATKLCEGPRSFVLFHVDADRPWAAREESENVEKFRQFIERDVLQFVEHRKRQLGDAPRRQPGIAHALPEPSITQLFRVTPHYSIEAWLYQNARLAADLCLADPRCRGGHVQRLEAWAQDRTLLDELPQPKTLICFGADHNLTLARQRFPADAVYDARKSFAETVDRLMACPALMAALAATYDA